MQRSQKTNKKPRNKGIIHDGINPILFNSINVIHSCVHCSHFNADDDSCSMGHPTRVHLMDEQMKDYNMSGKMALCRNLEID